MGNCAGCGVELAPEASFIQEVGEVCESCHLKSEQSLQWGKGTLFLGRFSALVVAIDVATMSMSSDGEAFVGFSVGAVMAGVFFHRLRTKHPDHQAEVAQIRLQDRLVAGLALAVSLALGGVQLLSMLGA
jgi:hypothetical protein